MWVAEAVAPWGLAWSGAPSLHSWHVADPSSRVKGNVPKSHLFSHQIVMERPQVQCISLRRG